MKLRNIIIIVYISCIYSFSVSFEPLTAKSVSKSTADHSKFEQLEQEFDFAPDE